MVAVVVCRMMPRSLEPHSCHLDDGIEPALVTGCRGPGGRKSPRGRGCLIVVIWAMGYERLTLGYTWDSTLGGYTMSVLSTCILVG